VCPFTYADLHIEQIGTFNNLCVFFYHPSVLIAVFFFLLSNIVCVCVAVQLSPRCTDSERYTVAATLLLVLIYYWINDLFIEC
jgi:hypothetical protein